MTANSNRRQAITWNRERQKQLRDARERAIAERKTEFTVEIEGQGKHEFDVKYAGYVLQWLDQEFAANPDQPRRENREGEEGQ